MPGVSIIVPAFNEERVIGDVLSSLLRINYPEFEVIVVDDGSTDGTHDAVDVVRHRAKIPVRYIRQRNSGKSAALNLGIAHARNAFVLCIDADSTLHPDVLLKGISHFSDPAVGAVGGYVEVANQNSLLTRFQQLEYMISLNFFRKAFSLLGTVLIVPGPVGLFRRDAIVECGGYREGKNVFSEDADLTVRLLSHGWKVRGDESMIAYTEAPATLFEVLRQRYRWKRGVYQAFHDNFYSLLTDRGLREVMIGCLLFSEAVLLDIANFGIMLFFLASFVRYGEINLLLTLYLVLVALDMAAVYVSSRNTYSFLRSVALFVLQKFSYSYVLQVWSVLALMDEWSSRQMRWDKLDRIGHLHAGEAP